MDHRWLVFAAITLSGMRPAGAAAQSSSCQTNADTAGRHIAFVTRNVTEGDSAHLAAQGIPYRPPDGVSLVTDTLTCRSIVDAYNAQLPNPTDPRRISRAYVMRVGTSAYAMVGEKGLVYVFFDTAYHWLAAFVGMQ